MSSSDENDRVVQNLLDAVWTTLNRPGLAVFAIGGDVQKSDPSSETTSSLAIRWDCDDQGQCHKLLLPVGEDPASKASFGMILEDCQPATFGVGSKEVLDEEYRKAGKLDDTAFSTSFNPYEHGIMDTINQVLAQGAHREGLGVRAEMYKLNVISLLCCIDRILTCHRFTLVLLASSRRTSILHDQIARWAHSSSVSQLRIKVRLTHGCFFATTNNPQAVSWSFDTEAIKSSLTGDPGAPTPFNGGLSSLTASMKSSRLLKGIA